MDVLMRVFANPQYVICTYPDTLNRYSRRIMWLKTCVTNNNPKVVAFYYLRAVEQIQGAPRLLRADCGTENSVVSFLQPYLCQDVNSFRFGSSVSNQVCSVMCISQ